MDTTVEVLDDGQLGGLAEAAGVEGVRAIIDAFWEATQDLTEQLAVALSENDFKALMQTGHAIKGSSANIGANLLAERARSVETAASDANVDALKDALAAFPADIQKTKIAIDALLARYA